MVLSTPHQQFFVLLESVPWRAQEMAALQTKVQQPSQAHELIADYFE